jgi:galactofuranose transport system substrate-binding protein
LTEVPAEVYEYKDLAVGFIESGSESKWRAAYYTSFRETAIALGSTFKHYDRAVEGTPYTIKDFQRFIQDSEVNVIVISLTDVTGWGELFQEAKDAGKIVILTDRHRRMDELEDLYATSVGSDFVEEGRKAGTEMCKLLEGSEKKNVWELVGTVGSSAAMERGAGFRETAAQCGIVIANSQTGNFIKTEGQQVTEAWLKESRDVQGVFAQNDDMGLGAIEALTQAGRVPAVDVKIVSIDATSAAFQAMLKGDLNVTVECNPWQAPQVYEAALATLNGETLPKWIPAKESVFHMDDPNLQEIAASRKY